MATFRQATDKRVAIFCAEGLEECEALVTRDVLWRAGIPAVLVSITDERQVLSSRGVTVSCDEVIGGLDWDSYDMLVLPGGMPGTRNLAACAPLADELVRFAQAGRPISAICAAPSVLAGLGLLKGREATANPNFQEALAEGGAHVHPDDPVVVDGPFTTSQGLGTAIAFGLAIVRRYLGQEAADATARGIVVL